MIIMPGTSMYPSSGYCDGLDGAACKQAEETSGFKAAPPPSLAVGG
ncbi:MAG TPA: hypothetical protein VF531_04940 [Bacillota bacterium]